MLLRPSNEIFVPALEPPISIYGRRRVVLTLITGAGVRFHTDTFLNPASRSAKMPAAFCEAFCNDHRDELDILLLALGVGIHSRLHRRDPTKVQGLLLGIN